MKFVKEEKALKSERSKLRRQIMPKIGQLTSDAQAISQIVRCLCLTNYHIPDVCLDTTKLWHLTLEHFPSIFFVKLVQTLWRFVIPRIDREGNVFTF